MLETCYKVFRNVLLCVMKVLIDVRNVLLGVMQVLGRCN